MIVADEQSNGLLEQRRKLIKKDTNVYENLNMMPQISEDSLACLTNGTGKSDHYMVKDTTHAYLIPCKKMDSRWIKEI